MKPDQAKAIAEVVGQNLQGEWMHTYKAINAVPDAKKDYKPETNSRSAWELAHPDCERLDHRQCDKRGICRAAR